MGDPLSIHESASKTGNEQKLMSNSKKARQNRKKRKILETFLSNIAPPGTLFKSGLKADGVLSDLHSDFNETIDILSSGKPLTSFKSKALPCQLTMFHAAKSWNGKRGHRKGDFERLERKRLQVQAFGEIINTLNLRKGAIIVDFGCGSCGLTLPLAYHFPKLIFVGVDLKERACSLMQQRANDAGLTNIRNHCGSVEKYDGDFDLAISLHACGSASDEVIKKAVLKGTPYLVSPCCVGKVQFSLSASKLKNNIDYVARTTVEKEGSYERLQYPRSQWLSKQLVNNCDTPEILFAYLASAADSSSKGKPVEERKFEDGFKHTMSTELFQRFCSNTICADRQQWAKEVGNYNVITLSIPGLETYCKSDLLVGLPPPKTTDCDPEKNRPKQA